MHIHSMDKWRHTHNFVSVHEKGERRTKQVLFLTVVTMVAEVIAGIVFGSMALLADGWHMGTHSAAFAITIFAYQYSKKHAEDRRFTFGTGKVSVLGGFASAVALAVVALVMAIESFLRFFDPRVIRFDEAIAVAVLGLSVNLVSAFLLAGHHDHGPDHHHGNDDDHEHHHDHNLRGAYLHVLADALTSILAIAALCFGKYLGWNWLDPMTGIVGAVLISRWSYGLLKDTSSILLDRNVDPEKTAVIKKTVEADVDNRVSDIHIWKVGPVDHAAMISIVTHFPKNPEHYKALLDGFNELTHLTVEVIPCVEPPCLVPNA